MSFSQQRPMSCTALSLSISVVFMSAGLFRSAPSLQHFVGNLLMLITCQLFNLLNHWHEFGFLAKKGFLVVNIISLNTSCSLGCLLPVLTFIYE